MRRTEGPELAAYLRAQGTTVREVVVALLDAGRGASPPRRPGQEDLDFLRARLLEG